MTDRTRPVIILPMSISIHQGSILDVQAAAIVNPANSFLNHAGGLAAVINRAAAPLAAKYPERPHMWEDADREWLNEQREAPLIATGNVHATSAGVLPYKAIIHAVGPIWNGGDCLETDLLEITMEKVMDLCEERGYQSVAVPAISCGIFGFPIPAAARILVSVASWYDIATTFALMEDAHVDKFQKQIGEPLFG